MKPEDYFRRLDRGYDQVQDNRVETAISEDKTVKAAHTPTPWVQRCFLITSQRGDWVTHTGMGNLPPSRSTESEANAAFIVKAVNAHDALVATARFVKEFLNNLENGTDTSDPLLMVRQRTHAPLHAVLDAALALAEGREPARGAEIQNVR